MDKVKIACVGLGGWGKNILRAGSQIPDAELRAICDTNSSVLHKFASQFPGVKTYTSYHDLLMEAGIDAVLLATPAPQHFGMASEALRAGKHVYVEKPMTLTVAEAETLVQQAETAVRTLMVGHLLEYHPAVHYLKSLIDKGDLGDLLYLYSKRLNLGVVRKEENALWSLAPHDISVILYLLGCEPERITASGQALLQPGIEDVVFVYLQFPQGRMAQIHVSWLDPHKERKLVVVGSKKMAVFDDMHPSEKIRVYDKSAIVQWSNANSIEAISVRHGEIQIPVIDNYEPLNKELQHFVDCVRTGETPRSDGHDGLRVIRVLEKAGRSLKANGKMIGGEPDSA
ncbi:MAG: Gfo/Idh/MocA family protein [bacterium]